MGSLPPNHQDHLHTSADHTASLPPPLCGAEVGTFAHHTVTHRMPDIARRTLAENDFPLEILRRFEALVAEMPDGFIRPLDDASAPDAMEWYQYATPYLGQTWLQVPWFFSETYFYRRILAITGYFQPGNHLDPYAHQKRAGLEAGLEDMRALSAQLDGWHAVGAWIPDTFTTLLLANLWGNQADLSMWPVDGGSGLSRRGIPHPEGTRLVVDDTASLVEQMFGWPPGQARVDIWLDNAGFELVCDLCLADYLLASRRAAVVVFHAKAHPTFVSDVIIADVLQTLAFLADDEHPAPRALASRLRGYLDQNTLRLRDHYYWTSPLPGWEMPPALREEFRKSHLVISKGDANYRRLLGDRHWPSETPFAEVVGYFPTPLLALRVCKSEMAAGLQAGLAATLSAYDPAWMTDGQWGIVQFWLPPKQK